MSKRAMLWMLGLIAFGFGYIAAVNVKEITPWPSSGVTCKGMWKPTEWFVDHCSESLPPRLAALAFGLVALVVLAYFAEKAGQEEYNYPHAMRWYTSQGRWVCQEPGCNFVTKEAEGATDHELLFADQPPEEDPPQSVPASIALSPSSAPLGFSNSGWTASSMRAAPESVPESAPREFKTCPDCAEEVRPAARKCRFCGYMFADAPANV